MTHEDEGHYAAKHGAGAVADERLAAAISRVASDGEVACEECERIAGETGATMGELGRTADLLELRIARCQLGLFGHAEGAEAHGKKVEAAASVDPALEAELRGAMVGGRLPCAAIWKAAAARGARRMEISAACEALKIKVKPCQLGAF